MTTCRVRIRTCVIATMFVVMCGTPPLVAVAAARQSSIQDWYQLYTSAKEDLKKQAWAEAQKKLLQAKRSGPEQGPRTLVRGGLIVPFSADYYLGEAYVGLGLLKEAVASFDAAAKQNLNLRTGEFARLGEYRATAVTRLTDDLIRTAQADVTNGDLSAARTKATEAGALGGNASGVENLLAGIKAAEDRASAKPAEGTGAVANPVTSGPPKETPLPANPAPETAPPAGAGTTGVPATTTNPGVEPAPKGGTVDPVRPTVYPDAQAESAAMRRFFTGDYQGALDALSPLDSPRALFYKACSRAGLVLLSGGSDAANLSLARQEYRRAVSGSANFSRDEPYISPRVLQLLQTQE